MNSDFGMYTYSSRRRNLFQPEGARTQNPILLVVRCENAVQTVARHTVRALARAADAHIEVARGVKRLPS